MIPYQVILVRLLFAAAMGAAIGVEREIHRRPAGMRTSMFVCMATALFTIVSVEISRFYGDSSPTRIAANIVQGIGFLGAGAILKDSAGLVGMTTAATIFAEAAIGMAAGGGMYAVSATATGIVLFGLLVLAWLADRLNIKSRMLVFRFTAGHAESVAGEVQRLLATLKIPVQHFTVSMSGTSSVVEFEAEVNHSQQEKIVEQLNRQGVTTEVLQLQGHHE
ncbi:MAG TPA: MgtC/SapB family protein [Candidatus Acidoferrum sp.]|nr:MgtC/SapB family protein [Candidatus Acidoferrum sp.]